MKITGMDFDVIQIPLKEPFYPCWIPGFPQAHNTLNLIRIYTDEGITGISACMALFKESIGLKDLLLPFLINRDPFDTKLFNNILRSATFLGFRLWYIEIAFWDILAKAKNQPLYQWLGSNKDKVKAYASTGEVRETKRRVEDALKIKKMGFQAIKLRAHSMNSEDDIKTVEAVRNALGDDFEIMVDANQGWPVYGLAPFPLWDFKTAFDFCQEMEKLNVKWVEEPLYKHDYDGLAKLRAETNIPIAGGEMNSDLHDFKILMEKGCLDIYQPDCTLSGGITTILEVIELTQKNNLKFTPHTWTNGIGLAANLHMAASAKNCEWIEFPYEPPGWTIEVRDGILKEPLIIDKEGFVHLPQKPGLGIEIDEEILQKYKIS